MSTQIALFAKGGLPTADMAHFKKSIVAAGNALRQVTGGTPFLRMQKDGMWVYGSDNTEVEEGSLWAINTFSMEMGYIAWGEEGSRDEGTVLGRRMALIGEGQPVERGSLPDVGAEWSPCVGFMLMCISGEDKGTVVKYETNSTGGRNAFADLFQLVQKAIVEESDKLIPIVELDSSSYAHKKYGKIYTPEFVIKKWTMPDAAELGGQPTPAEPTNTAAAPEPQEEKAAPEGAVRTRRRR